jgi:succinoglycan biosynthesis transport protein ExoP
MFAKASFEAPAIMMSLEQLLPTLKARWGIVLMTWLAIVAAVLLISLALPPRYEATATLALEMNGVDPINGQVFKPAGAVSTHMATQADIIKSDEVALGVVRAFKLQAQPEWRERWTGATGGSGEIEPWIAAQLLRKVDVRPSRDSNVLTIGYTSADPVASAAIANAWVRAYADMTAQMRAGPAREINSFFTERAKPLREALEQARARLSAYEKEHGISVGTEPDVENARLAELTSQLISLQDASAEAANMRQQARNSPGDMREVRNDPEVAALTGELVRQEGQLAELKSEFGESHHAVIQARQSIRDARRRLDAAMRRSAEALAAPARVVDARLADVKAAIQRQRALVQQRKSQRDGAAVLVRDVENAQKAYDAVLARASQTSLESKNTAQTSISVLKSATPPLLSWGFLIRNLVVAALAGMLIAIAVGLVAEARRPRLRTIEDVTRRLQQPMLLVLPDASAGRGSDSRAEQTRRRLVSSQPRLTAFKWGSS